ncbi:MAG: protein kinase [Candidatus Peribacteraceae bacterium]
MDKNLTQVEGADDDSSTPADTGGFEVVRAATTRNSAESSIVHVDQSGRRFVPIAPIGKGAQGQVFCGRLLDGDSETLVAVKTSEPRNVANDLQGQKAVHRFAREVRALERMAEAGCGHISAALEQYGTLDGTTPYYATRFVHGVDARVFFEEMREYNPQLSTKLAVDMFLLLCAHLYNLSRLHIVHRDIKPSNIHIGSDGVVRLLDFGLVRINGDVDDTDIPSKTITEMGAIVGSPQYMSPEHVTGNAHDVCTQSDLYSLAATVWTEGLQNDVLFDAEGNLAQIAARKEHNISTKMERLRQHLAATLPTNPETGKVIETIIACFSKEASDRPRYQKVINDLLPFSSFAQDAKDFDAFIEGTRRGRHHLKMLPPQNNIIPRGFASGQEMRESVSAHYPVETIRTNTRNALQKLLDQATGAIPKPLVKLGLATAFTLGAAGLWYANRPTNHQEDPTTPVMKMSALDLEYPETLSDSVLCDVSRHEGSDAISEITMFPGTELAEKMRGKGNFYALAEQGNVRAFGMRVTENQSLKFIGAQSKDEVRFEQKNTDLAMFTVLMVGKDGTQIYCWGEWGYIVLRPNGKMQVFSNSRVEIRDAGTLETFAPTFHSTDDFFDDPSIQEIFRTFPVKGNIDPIYSPDSGHAGGLMMSREEAQGRILTFVHNVNDHLDALDQARKDGTLPAQEPSKE